MFEKLFLPLASSINCRIHLLDGILGYALADIIWDEQKSACMNLIAAKAVDGLNLPYVILDALVFFRHVF